ncbi:MAG: hypothetical protein AAGI44_11055, partial [Pseudomonadota bacterium]
KEVLSGFLSDSVRLNWNPPQRKEARACPALLGMSRAVRGKVVPVGYNPFAPKVLPMCPE